MPYIPQPDRDRLAAGAIPVTPGELNYCITRLVDGWITRTGLSYTTLNAAIGALECAKLELYRRRAGPYEDAKREANGDVYGSGPT